MKTMNEAVQTKLGQLILTICEAEVAIAQRDERIAELEAELAKRPVDTKPAPDA